MEVRCFTAIPQFSGWPHVKCFWAHGRPCPNTVRVCCADGRRWVAFGFCVGFLQRLDDVVIWMVLSCHWSFYWNKSTLAFNMFENLLQKKSIPRMFRCECSWKDQVGISTDKTRNKNHWLLLLYWFWFHIFNQDISSFLHPAITVHPAITAGMCIWNDGTVIFLDVIKRFSKGISHKKTVKHWSFWEFVWWIQLASIEIQFWWIDFFEKPTSLWPPFFQNLGYWKSEATMFHDFSLWVRGVNVNLRGSRCHTLEWNDEISSNTPCRIQLCTAYLPKRRRGSLQTCLILDILWYFLKFFSDFSVIRYWIDSSPIKVLGFFDLQIWWFAWLKRTARPLQENLELMVWNLEILEFGKTPEILGELRCWYLTSNIVDAFRVMISPGKSHPLPWKWLRSDRSNGAFQLKSVETVQDSFWETQVSWQRYLQTQCIWMQTYCIMKWHMLYDI